MTENSGKEIGDIKDDVSGMAKNAEGGAIQSTQEEMEDWDKTRDGTSSILGDGGKETSGDGQYKSFGRANGRSLAQLMSPHASKGKELIMTEEEEQRLAAELGKWINTDTNPYETQEDSYFKAQAAE